jgi:hypothetical protein
MSYTAILLKIKAIGRPITMGLSEPQELKNGLKAAAMKVAAAEAAAKTSKKSRAQELVEQTKKSEKEAEERFAREAVCS